MNIDIFFTILFTSLIQSIFGTGILLFGTPVLLMLGNNFQTTLTILLPASILVNCFQLRNNFKNIDCIGLKTHISRGAVGMIQYASIINLEYFDSEDFLELSSIIKNSKLFIAYYLNNVRLIDNI